MMGIFRDFGIKRKYITHILVMWALRKNPDPQIWFIFSIFIISTRLDFISGSINGKHIGIVDLKAIWRLVEMKWNKVCPFAYIQLYNWWSTQENVNNERKLKYIINIKSCSKDVFQYWLPFEKCNEKIRSRTRIMITFDTPSKIK